MTPTLKGWCAKYDFQCLCLPIPFLLIASITDLYDDSDYRCLFSLSLYVKDLWLLMDSKLLDVVGRGIDTLEIVAFVLRSRLS